MKIQIKPTDWITFDKQDKTTWPKDNLDSDPRKVCIVRHPEFFSPYFIRFRLFHINKDGPYWHTTDNNYWVGDYTNNSVKERRTGRHCATGDQYIQIEVELIE